MRLNNNMRNKIKRDVLRNVRRMNIKKKYNLHLKNDELEKGTKLNAGLRKIDLPKKTAVVLVDKNPTLNWGHPCEHLLFDTETGELYERIEADFPPNDFFTNPENFEGFHMPTTMESVLASKKLAVSPIPAITNALTKAR